MKTEASRRTASVHSHRVIRTSMSEDEDLYLNNVSRNENHLAITRALLISKREDDLSFLALQGRPVETPT